jgi:hypothetical protein
MVGGPSDADIAAGIISDGLVYTRVAITKAAAGVVDLGVGAVGEIVRLHGLALTMRSQGTVTIGYDNDGLGDTPVVLSGPMSLGAGGGIMDPFNADTRGALTATVNKHLTITFATAGGDGYAYISKGPA